MGSPCSPNNPFRTDDQKRQVDSMFSDHLKNLNSNPNAVSVSLLISTLVEELCGFYEHDPHRRELLCRVVCNQLVEMSLLSPLAYLDELAAIRARYRETFMQILKMGQVLATEQAGKLKAVGVPLDRGAGNGFTIRTVSAAATNTQQTSDQCVVLPSRYQEEFEEVRLLGHGGFGRVFQARNRVDGQEYAVKKIRLPRKSSRENILKIFREVKVLAGLHHKHVVGYNAAWLELENEGGRKSPSPNHLSQNLEDSLAEIKPSVSASPRKSKSSFPITKSVIREFEKTKKSEEDSDGVVFERGDSEGDLVSSMRKGKIQDDPIDYASELPSVKLQTAALSKTPIVLFIQMELCGKTLRDWLHERNGRAGKGRDYNDLDDVVDVIECSRIIKHISKGIEYIHSKGLIHRDLKPRNIFFHPNGNAVMIGDFGLAKKDLLSEMDDHLLTPKSPVRRHSAGVGTVTYASPEQLHGSAYDMKSDIFSLGIVMFEVYWPFSTEMERAQRLMGIRAGHLPSDFKTAFPKEAVVIESLLKTEAASRPTARQILNSNLFMNHEQMIYNLQQKVSKLEAQLAEKPANGLTE